VVGGEPVDRLDVMNLPVRSAPAGLAPHWHHRPTRRAHAPNPRSANARPGPQALLLRTDRDRQDGERALATCKCDNSHRQTPPCGRTGWWPGKSHPSDERGFAQVTGSPTLVQCRESAVVPAARAGGRCPIRTHVRRPKPPLLYFAAVLTVRSVRIMLPTSGAKAIRTPDLLHAIWRQHVHPRPSRRSPSPCVPARPPPSACVAVLPCCTVAAPPGATSRAPRGGPDQRQPCIPGYRCALRRASGQTGPGSPRHSPATSPHPQPRTVARLATNTGHTKGVLQQRPLLHERARLWLAPRDRNARRLR
jgi:hypothetical protein